MSERKTHRKVNARGSTEIAKERRTAEDFAAFFQSPTREGLRDLIKDHAGEFDWLDFKEEWILGSKLAKHILGMANCGGAVVVFGIKQEDDGTTTIPGLAKLEDKADIRKSVQKYIPGTLTYEVMDFPYEDSEYGLLVGKKLQVMFIDGPPLELPYVCTASGDKIQEGAIYVRRGTSSEVATHDEVQAILARRLDTEFSGTAAGQLHEHLSQLKVLFEYHAPVWMPAIPNIGRLLGGRSAESFEEFVTRMINEKKAVIEKVLGAAQRDHHGVDAPGLNRQLDSLFTNPPSAPPGRGS